MKHTLALVLMVFGIVGCATTTPQETYELPVPDILTKATSYTKQCIWLNNNYIRDDIYLKKIENDI